LSSHAHGTWFSLCLLTWALILPRSAEGQVGLVSRVAQVTLVAHAVPGGRLPSLGQIRQIRHGGVRETAALVRFSTNAGYRLVVKRLGRTGSRLWVKSASGEYQELTANAPVTVVLQPRGSGEEECEIRFREDDLERGEPAAAPLIRYDLVMSPTL
jgi:hypothetical protein